MFPLRIRLTLVFGSLLFLALVLSGAAVITILRLRLTAHLEASLDHRLRGVESFLIRETTAATDYLIPLELEEYAFTQPEGDFIDVSDANGDQLLRSEPLSPPFISRERTFTLYGQTFYTKASGSTEQIDQAVWEVTTLLAWSSPLLMILIGLTGYWISRGALRSVDEMTTAARSIGAKNLDGRLSVPQPQDEIRRLAEAWNEMLSRLEESFSRMNRFTEDAAHELRTPLSVLRVSVELALRRPREPEEYRQTLGDVLKTADRLNLLTQGLLLLARGEHPRILQNIERVNIVSLVRDLAMEMEPLFGDKQIHLTLDTPSVPLHIDGEADSLRRLLVILLDNALKYTPSGGTVTVRAQENEEGLLLGVTDTGCGIPAELLPLIFDRFFRVDPSRNRVTGGYGLGLAIAQQIARAHNGQIDVSSTLGEGSSFQVQFPKDALRLG